MLAKLNQGAAAAALGEGLRPRRRDAGRDGALAAGSQNALRAVQPGSLEVQDVIHKTIHAGYRVKKMRVPRDGSGSGAGSLERTHPVHKEESLKKLVHDFSQKIDTKNPSFTCQKPWGHGGPSLSFVSRPNVDPNQLGWGAYDLRDPIQQD